MNWRRWLHDLGIHRWCRISRVKIEQSRDFNKEYIKGIDGLIDITSQAGRPVYEDQYGKVHYKEVHA